MKIPKMHSNIFSSLSEQQTWEVWLQNLAQKTFISRLFWWNIADILISREGDSFCAKLHFLCQLQRQCLKEWVASAIDFWAILSAMHCNKKGQF